MTDFFLLCKSPVSQREMDFWLRPDGTLQVDSPELGMPFLVEVEAVYALYQYLKEREEKIMEAQRQHTQNLVDLHQMYGDKVDTSPRFELVPYSDSEAQSS